MTAAALTDTTGIVALAAGAAAIVALLSCALLARTLRRVRHAQRMVLGDGSQRDVIAHGASLQQAFEALEEYVGEVASRLDTRLSGAEQALAGTITHRALVRYDAYNELSGQQSVSIALLDNHRSGVVLSCIHHRDQARVYAKQLRAGRAELELSPEERQAVELALSDHSAAPVQATRRSSSLAAPADAPDAAGI